MGKQDLSLWGNENPAWVRLLSHPSLIWQYCRAMSQTLPWMNIIGELLPDPKGLGRNINE